MSQGAQFVGGLGGYRVNSSSEFPGGTEYWYAEFEGIVERTMLPMVSELAVTAAGLRAYSWRRLQLGSFMISPPFRADSCARMPVQVMLADSTALG